MILKSSLTPSLNQSLRGSLSALAGGSTPIPLYDLLTDLPPEIYYNFNDSGSVSSTDSLVDGITNLGTLGATANWTSATTGRPVYDPTWSRAIFQSGNYLGGADLAGFNSSGDLSVFIVFERQVVTGGVEALFNQYQTSGSRRSFSLGIDASSNIYSITSTNGSSDETSIAITNATVDIYDVNLLTFIYDSGTNTRLIRLNGNTVYSASGVAGGLFNSTAALGINLINGVATGNFRGSLFALVGYNSSLSQEDYENVEASLANEWDSILSEYVEAPTPSVNLSSPVITPAATLGGAWTTTNGTWTNNPTSYTYAWKLRGSTVSTAATWTPATGEDTANITVEVVAVNAGGSSTVAVSAGVYIGVLDLTPSVTGSAVYSLRRMRRGYTGSAIRVRRTSDNAEQDIGFTTDGDLDTTALTAFVGAGSGFIKTWYDQSGSGLHAEQTNTANQPRIANAGVIDTQNSKPANYFNAGPYLETASTSLFPGSLLVVGYSSTAAGFPHFIRQNAGGGGAGWYLRRHPAALQFASGAVNILGGVPSSTAIDVLSFNNISPATTYINGSSAATGTQLSGSNTVNTLTVGSGPGGSEFLTGYMSEILQIGSALTTAQQQIIERSQGAYYGVTVA